MLGRALSFPRAPNSKSLQAHGRRVPRPVLALGRREPLAVVFPCEGLRGGLVPPDQGQGWPLPQLLPAQGPVCPVAPCPHLCCWPVPAPSCRGSSAGRPVTLSALVHSQPWAHLEASLQCVTVVTHPCQNRDLRRLSIVCRLRPCTQGHPLRAAPLQNTAGLPSIPPPSTAAGTSTGQQQSRKK